MAEPDAGVRCAAAAASGAGAVCPVCAAGGAGAGASGIGAGDTDGADCRKLGAVAGGATRDEGHFALCFGAKRPRRTQWVDPSASSALALLALADRRPCDGARRPGCALPPCLYADEIAPFLHFDAPVPNQLYAVGGRNKQTNPLDTVEMFDTWHGSWVACPHMLSRRAGCAAALLGDGRLFVVGGYDERGIVSGLLDSCEIFDAARQAWQPAEARLLRARWGHGCATLGGLVYAVGGCSLRPGSPPTEACMETLRSCEVYDPSLRVWAQCGELHVPRAGARVVALGDCYLAAVGGCDDVFGRAELLPTVELLDRRTGRWALLSSQLSTPRTTAAVAALDDGQILITGGAPSLSSSEVYRLPGQTDPRCAERIPSHVPGLRTPVGDLAQGRMGCQAVTMDLPPPQSAYPFCTRQCVVVVGGENGDEAQQDGDHGIRQFSSVLVYDREDAEWRRDDSVPPIPTPRTAMALCVGPGRISGFP